MRLEKIIEGLIGVKNLANNSWPEIEQLLLQNGFRILGVGSSAKVFEHPSKDYVYKIFDNDKAYSSYISYCLNNRNNPHIPNIIKQPKEFKKFFKHKDQENSFTVLRIEKLNDLQGDVRDFYNVRLQYNIIMYLKFGANQIFRDHYDTTKAYRGINQYINAYPQFQFKEVFDTLIDIYKSIGFFADISPSNFMQRDDGTIVIIDPVAEQDLVKDTMFKHK